MKKISAILMALVLVVMACVPFSASAADDVVIAVSTSAVTAGDETVDVTVTLTNNTILMNGGFFVEYDPEVLTVEIPVNKKGDPNPNALSEMPGAAVNVFMDEADPTKQAGLIKLAFMDASGVEDETMIVFKGTFKLAEPAVAGTSYGIKGVYACQLVDDTNTDLAEANNTSTEPGEVAAFAADMNAPNAVQKAVAPTTTTVAPTTTTAAATTTTAAAATTTAAAVAATTTKAPVSGGEATPWALMATVAVAGAALVVLSTKKSK